MLGCIVNDWQLSGVWTGATGTPYAAAFSYQNGGSNVNLTGSPDFGARIRIVGDAGGGCSSNQYAQFTASAFQGPLVGSAGLESSNNYLKGCFASALDLSLAARHPAGRQPASPVARRRVQRPEPVAASPAAPRR